MFENQLKPYVGETAMTPRRTSVTERLKDEKESLEKRLAQINEVLGVLEANPQVQSVLDAVSKLNIVY